MSNALTQGLGMLDFLGALTWAFYFLIAVVGAAGIAFILFKIFDFTTWNVKAELIYPVGKPFYQVIKNNKGETEKKKVVSVEIRELPAKLFNKKIKPGTYKEYFKVKTTNYNRVNIFDPSYFYRRTNRGPLDFMTKGIKLFMDPKKGPIPLSILNPVLEVAPISMNSVISAFVSTQKDIDERYENDFWTKYGAAITVGLILITIVASFIFMIKIQEISWERAGGIISRLLEAGRNQAAPPIK